MENENLNNTAAQDEPQDKMDAQELSADEEINPADLVFSEEEMGGDSDMPEPETHDYNKKADEASRELEPKPMFYRLFYQCLGSMPANTMFTNEAKQQITIAKLMAFMNAKIDAEQTTMKVSDMNTILSFIMTAPMNQVQPLADMVTHNQGKLWTVR